MGEAKNLVRILWNTTSYKNWFPGHHIAPQIWNSTALKKIYWIQKNARSSFQNNTDEFERLQAQDKKNFVDET